MTWLKLSTGAYVSGAYRIERANGSCWVVQHEEELLARYSLRSLKEAKAWAERREADLAARGEQEANTRAERAARLAHLCSDWTHLHVHLDAGRLRLVLGAARVAEALGDFLRGVHCEWCCSGSCEEHECDDSLLDRHDRAEALANEVESTALALERTRPSRRAA